VKYGRECLLIEESQKCNETFVAAYMSEVLPICPLFAEIWRSWGRVVDVLIDVLVLVDRESTEIKRIDSFIFEAEGHGHDTKKDHGNT